MWKFWHTLLILALSGCGGLAEESDHPLYSQLVHESPGITEDEPDEMTTQVDLSRFPPIEEHWDFCPNGPEDGGNCDCEGQEHCDGPQITDTSEITSPTSMTLNLPWGSGVCSTGAVQVALSMDEGCAVLVSTSDWWVGPMDDGCPRTKRCHHIQPGEWVWAGTFRDDTVGEINFYPDPLCEMSCPEEVDSYGPRGVE